MPQQVDMCYGGYVPKWRNWQTRYVQGVVGETPCGFESHLRHQMVGNSLMVERLTLDQVVGVRIPVPQPWCIVFPRHWRGFVFTYTWFFCYTYDFIVLLIIKRL